MLLIYGNRKVGGMRQNNATGKLRMAPMRELPVVQSNRAAQVGRWPSALATLRKCVGQINIRRYELPNWRVAPSAPSRPTWAAKQRLGRCSPESRFTMLTLSFVVHGGVEMWRGGFRLHISVAAPFVWRCLSGATVTPFPHPARRTGQADLPHPALGQDLTPSPTAGRGQARSGVRAQSARKGARVDRSRLCVV
jgi:hypothetical protein